MTGNGSDGSADLPAIRLPVTPSGERLLQLLTLGHKATVEQITLLIVDAEDESAALAVTALISVMQRFSDE